jgi:hypothetical protein
MMETNSFKARQLSAEQYVLALHRPEDRIAVLVRNRARGQTMQRILSAEDVASPLFQDWLAKQNDAGGDIFVGMNPLHANSFTRTKESICEIRHVYLDLDEDAAVSLRAIRTDGNTPVPNFVLDTSAQKNQVIWRVEGLDREQAEYLLRSLATQFRGDIAATDISRVLRMPGFANQKYNEAFLVRAVQEIDAVYNLRDFAIQEDSPEEPRRPADAHERSRRMPAGHRSQSEADWAYAKRALARGDHPDQIIQRIADYRAEDKADPLYYARHTVEKACAHLEQNRSIDRCARSSELLRASDHPPDGTLNELTEDRATDRR